MHRILSYPFRLGPSGEVVTVVQESEAADQEQVGVLALTVLGERLMLPGFGVTDPRFGGYLPAEIAAGVATYGPPVQIHAVETEFLDETSQIVRIHFE